MKRKPIDGDVVKCIYPDNLRVPVVYGTRGFCEGDVWGKPNYVWVRFDGTNEAQMVDWLTNIDFYINP